MKIVIVGGGFCGSLLALKLNTHPEYETILIDKKPYFEYTPGIPKIIKGKKLEKITRLYKRFLKHIHFKQEEVTTISPNMVTTHKQTYFYDILVICTGVTYPVPIDNSDSIYTIKNGKKVCDMKERINQSQKIVIIGGGVVGIETAAEIVKAYPEKKVIIVHSKNRLLERNSAFVSEYAHHFFIKHHVQILYNTRIINYSNNYYLTDKDTAINADVGIWCAGNKPDASFMKNFQKDIISKEQYLKVNKNLQLVGYKNIFVGGDITDIPEEKTAFSADRHALTIYNNIINTIKSKPLTDYKVFPTLLFISLGNLNGIISFSHIGFPGFAAIFGKYIIERLSLQTRS